MTSTTHSPVHGRIIELDALRGIAAIAILIFHLPRGFWFGATGVDLFFVLSGFLITSIILREYQRPRFLRTFYWRRSLRIFPIYYLALSLAFGLNWLRSSPAETSGFPYYLLYLQHIHQYWGSATPPANISLGHTWTLAIEEQFYLFWPLLLLCVKQRLIPWIIGTFLFLPIVLRSLGLSPLVLLGHSDGLALGALLAWLLPRTAALQRRTKAVSFALFGAGSLLLYLSLWRFNASTDGMSGKEMIAANGGIFLISLTYFNVIGWIVCMSGTPALALLRNKLLVGIGTISYGLYLYHWIIYEALDTVIKFGMRLGDPWWLDVTKVALSLTAAVLSWRYVERRILRYRDHRQPDREAKLIGTALLAPAIGGAATHD